MRRIILWRTDPLDGFKGGWARRLRLADAGRFGNGVVSLRYERRGAGT